MGKKSLTIHNYDEAVVAYFKDIFENVEWGDPTTAFKNNALHHKDQVQLPFMSVYRAEIMLNPNRNFALFKHGTALKLDDSSVVRERILPMIFSYQLDIWASNDEMAAALFSEILFYTLDHPTVKVNMPGAENEITNYLDITDVVDNTDTSLISSRGRLYRFTIIYQLHGHIAKIEKNDRIKVVPEFYTFDGEQLN